VTWIDAAKERCRCGRGVSEPAADSLTPSAAGRGDRYAHTIKIRALARLGELLRLSGSASVRVSR
jgi:hypothetical protein